MSDSDGFLVPLSDTDTLDSTVRYVVENAEEDEEIRFAVVVDRLGDQKDRMEEAENLLDKTEVLVEEDDTSARTRFEIVETEGYLFSPTDYARLLVDYADDHGLGRIVLDPEYGVSATTPKLQPLEAALRRYGVEVERGPGERRTRRSRVLTRGGGARFLTVFVLSYGFYLSIGSLKTFDLLTGAFAAVLVSTVLYRVSFESTPVARRVPVVMVRFILYTPYLLWEIVKANFQIAYVVLHPDLPIDPSVEEFESMVWGGFPVTTLANSITLTPGTLTVEADGRKLHVHALTSSSREDLLNGGLERAVRFVFYGRRAMDVPSPRDRGEDE